MPDWTTIGNKDVWITAVTLALVASLETLLSIEAIDDLDPYQRVTNKERELKAQGVGNLLSGLIGGLPVTSVIVRSSANVNSGAKTKMSAIITRPVAAALRGIGAAPAEPDSECSPGSRAYLHRLQAGQAHPVPDVL
jgi:MFS superfamily sulfate permease-like transporter